jgi:hypothetical protein
MASGSDKRRRSHQSLIRWTDEEFTAISEKADKAGLAVAAFMRATALGNPGPRAQRRPPADHRALRQILGEIGRIGNNINQIARAINSGDQANIPELQGALRAYLEIRNRILDALGKNHGSDDAPKNGPGP